MKWGQSNTECQYKEFFHIQFIYPVFRGTHTGKEWRHKISSYRQALYFLFLPLDSRNWAAYTPGHQELLVYQSPKNGFMIHLVYLGLLTDGELYNISTYMGVIER